MAETNRELSGSPVLAMEECRIIGWIGSSSRFNSAADIARIKTFWLFGSLML